MHRTNNEPDYRALMDGIEMPSRLKGRILDETRHERAAASRTLAPDAKRQRGAQPVSRRRFIGVAVAAVGAVACGGTAVFAAVGRPAPNSFSLELGDFGYDGVYKVWRSDPEIDPNNADNAPDEGRRYLSVAYRFNPICTGANVSSLTYEVEGERVLFYTRPTSLGSTDTKGNPLFEEHRTADFTVDYDEQRQTAENLWRGLRASFPLEGQLADSYDAVQEEFYSGRRDIDFHRQDRLYAQLAGIYADIVAQARLHLTVTYEDESTETKTYVIAPVDNLEETMVSYYRAARAQSQAAQEAGENFADTPETIVPPPLFTLAELA